jgi:hypothetical protein
MLIMAGDYNVDAKSHVIEGATQQTTLFYKFKFDLLMISSAQFSSGGALVPLTTWNYVIMFESYDLTF